MTSFLRKRSPAVSTLLLVASVLLVGGCAMRHLRKDVERLDQYGLLGGHVTQTQEDEGTVVVVLLSPPPAAKVLDSFVVERSGPYFFNAPPGTYQIAAFADRNRDFIYEPNEEPAAYYGAPTDVRLAAGEKVSSLDVHLPPTPQGRLAVAISLSEPGSRRMHALPPIRLGEIVTLDDPRFAADKGNLGMWQPVEFMFEVGAGFYFLEAYDPHKVPVLFVHGAGGTPADFRYLVEHLDRSKFQPWLIYYPSGMDLEMVARGAARWINTLAARYQLQRMIIVAHSMGGLVSRATINQMTTNGDGGLLALFVSMSSPWGGYAAAALGAEHSPVVMPMWTDMAPGSPFLDAVFQTPLPPQCPYYLFFSYGGHSMLLNGANDGVVELSSELVWPAQQAASKLYGFDQTHVGILSTPEASQTLNALLAGALH